MIPKIAAFAPHSMIEWEGRLSAVLILQGCNYRCPFCHSSKFVPPGDPDPYHEWDEIADRLDENRDWIDGVVVTGGEPTIHAGLEELLAALAELEFKRKLDTNGSSPDRLASIIDGGLVEHVALDVKAPLNEEAHAVATGRAGSLQSVLKSLEILKQGTITYELRTTVFAPVFESDESILELAKELSWADRWYLQGFQPVHCLDESAMQLDPTSPSWLGRMVERCRAIAPGCRVRGG